MGNRLQKPGLALHVFVVGGFEVVPVGFNAAGLAQVLVELFPVAVHTDSQGAVIHLFDLHTIYIYIYSVKEEFILLRLEKPRVK